MKHLNQYIHILDTSPQLRLGLKGVNAAMFLQQKQITVPSAANQWVMNQNKLLLRLGETEFLIEPADGKTPAYFAEVLNTAGIYTVSRADAVFTLTGNGRDDLLAEICALDLPAMFKAAPQAVIMTSLAGVSAILIRQTLAEHTAYRIWCDASYHHYMQSTLTAVAQDIATLNFKTM